MLQQVLQHQKGVTTGVAPGVDTFAVWSASEVVRFGSRKCSSWSFQVPNCRNCRHVGATRFVGDAGGGSRPESANIWCKVGVGHGKMSVNTWLL